jgi:two-component system response regulator FixJ
MDREMIAIIDDDEAVRHSLGMLLESDGFEARKFAGGAQFLESGTAVPWLCVLLDLHMPGMSGIEVLQAFRSRGDLSPVIVISGNCSGDIRQRALAAGAAQVLEKPFHLDELLCAINDIAGHCESYQRQAQA